MTMNTAEHWIIEKLASMSQRPSHLFGHLDKQLCLGVRQFPADRHQAAVGREPKILRLDVFERCADTFDDLCDGWQWCIAGIDAAEHHDAAFACCQHGGVVVAARKFDTEAADLSLHQLVQ